jgi:hypothetical protein
MLQVCVMRTVEERVTSEITNYDLECRI